MPLLIVVGARARVAESFLTKVGSTNDANAMLTGTRVSERQSFLDHIVVRSVSSSGTPILQATHLLALCALMRLCGDGKGRKPPTGRE